MIVDTSAVVAVLLGEDRRTTIVAKLARADRVRMSAASYLELGIVIDRLRDPVLSRQVDALLTTLQVDVVPVDVDQARTARAAYRDFGRGTGHAAGLNYGDCFSYALAREADDELLFVGDDFGHTDVRRA